MLTRASSQLPLSAWGAPSAEPHPEGRARAPRAGPGGGGFLLSFPSFPRPCPWSGSGAWSAAAQPRRRPRARGSGAAAPPARRTWVRKAEGPAGPPQGWRPRSLSATRSTTRSPHAGARAEELTSAPLRQTGPALLRPCPLGHGAPPCRDQRGRRIRRCRGRCRGRPAPPLPSAAVEEKTTLSSGRDPTFGPSSHPEEGSSSEGLGSRPLPSPSSYFRLSRLVVLGFCPPAVPSPPARLLPPRPPGARGLVGGRGVTLPSLSSALVLLAVWMVLPSPVPCLWGHLSVFLLLFFFIY